MTNLVAVKLDNIEKLSAILPKEYIYDNSNFKNRYGYQVNGEFKGIAYYSVPTDIKLNLLRYFFGDSIYQFDVALMIITNDNIQAHTDSNVKTVINIYIETGEAVTHFYKEKHTKTRLFKIEGQTDGNIYDMADIEEIYRFKAEKYDTWLLNVSMIHSVSSAKSRRVAYCINTTLDYESVLKLLIK